MDANLLIFGRPAPPILPIRLSAGPLSLELHPETGAIRFLELPDGTEAVRGVYPSLRTGNWGTVEAKVEDLKFEGRESGFEVSFGLTYELGYTAKVQIKGDETGIVYAYEGVAQKGFETSRTGLCILHPSTMADQPLEVRHPDGTRESGRFPDLVQPDWPYRDIVGISTKLPGFKVEITMEGEIFEMEDQRNYGDASFKTYCRPQSRPFPYNIAEGERVTQTVRITAKPWGSKVEGLEPMPLGVAGLLFLEETLPVPLIGLIGGEDPDPRAVAAAPADYIRMPAAKAVNQGKPLELTLDLSEDAEARIESAVAHIATLGEPPERVIVSPLSAVQYIPSLREKLDEILVLVEGSDLVSINHSPLKPADADGVGFGWHPQAHLIDDQTLFENVEAIPDIAATVAERTEGPIVAGPIRLKHGGDPRTGSLLFASWLVLALVGTMQSDVDAVTLFDLEGPDGLFRDGKVIPAYHVLYDLFEFADGELIVGMGTSRRAAGFALVMEENFRAIVANLTPEPLILAVIAAGDGPHEVKILDGRSVERAVESPMAWREEEGEIYMPSEGTIEIELGPYGVARIDAEVDDIEEEA